MFNEEQLLVLSELVEDKVTVYRKLLNEARWAGLATTESYLAGQLNRLQGIAEQLREAGRDGEAPQIAPDENLAPV